MKSIKRILGTGCLLLATSVMVAQKSDFGVWTSIEGSTKLNKQLELSLEGEYRTQDMSSMTERIATGISLSYKNKNFLPFLKADVGYSFMSMNYQGETTIKYETEEDGSYELDGAGNPIPKHMNVDDAYWVARHRFTASLTGSVKWGRFKFSLRERYQFTHRMRSYCDRERYYYFESLKKWDYELSDFEQPELLTDEKKSKSDHKLRSRLAVSYDIKKCPFEPFAEVEVYNELDNAFAYDKIRYTVGTEYKINKEHKLKLYYRYQDYADIDEVSGHVLGIGYAFEF
jgi:hypothetical protein